MSILAIDAGTTGVTALVVTGEGTIAATARQELRQHVPQPGWVEHSPEEIWQAARAAVRDCIAAWAGSKSHLRGIGITNQRGTVLLWDRETLGSPRRAITWQDRRTTELCRRLEENGHADRFAELTGMRLDPGLSGTKLAWLREHEPNTWALVEDGRYAVGTLDSYLVARMTRGTWHLTDASNARGTLLLDVGAVAWSQELCDLFGVPREALPEIGPSWGRLATTDPRSFLDLELPVAGIAADRPAARFGQRCFGTGDSDDSAAHGVAFMAGLGTGVWESTDDLRRTWESSRE